MVAYKSGDETELQEAKKAVELLGGGEMKIYRYELPEGYGSRTLAEVKKISRTPENVSAGQGLPRKAPL